MLSMLMLAQHHISLCTWSSSDLTRVSFKIFSGVGSYQTSVIIVAQCFAQVDHWWLNPGDLSLFAQVDHWWLNPGDLSLFAQVDHWWLNPGDLSLFSLGQQPKTFEFLDGIVCFTSLISHKHISH